MGKYIISKLTSNFNNEDAKAVIRIEISATYGIEKRRQQTPVMAQNTGEPTKLLEGRIWDLIVSVPDHCLSFYFAQSAKTQISPDLTTL